MEAPVIIVPPFIPSDIGDVLHSLMYDVQTDIEAEKLFRERMTLDNLLVWVYRHPDRARIQAFIQDSFHAVFKDSPRIVFADEKASETWLRFDYKDNQRAHAAEDRRVATQNAVSSGERNVLFLLAIISVAVRLAAAGHVPRAPQRFSAVAFVVDDSALSVDAVHRLELWMHLTQRLPEFEAVRIVLLSQDVGLAFSAQMIGFKKLLLLHSRIRSLNDVSTFKALEIARDADDAAVWEDVVKKLTADNDDKSDAPLYLPTQRHNFAKQDAPKQDGNMTPDDQDHDDQETKPLPPRNPTPLSVYDREWFFTPLINSAALRKAANALVNGQRRLFVEGETDIELYQSLFPDWEVRHLSGCHNVQSFMVHLKSIENVLREQSSSVPLPATIGIVDLDQRTGMEIQYLRDHDVFTLQVSAAECLYLVPELMDVVLPKALQLLKSKPDLWKHFVSAKFGNTAADRKDALAVVENEEKLRAWLDAKKTDWFQLVTATAFCKKTSDTYEAAFRRKAQRFLYAKVAEDVQDGGSDDDDDDDADDIKDAKALPPAEVAVEQGKVKGQAKNNPKAKAADPKKDVAKNAEKECQKPLLGRLASYAADQNEKRGEHKKALDNVPVDQKRLEFTRPTAAVSYREALVRIRGHDLEAGSMFGAVFFPFEVYREAALAHLRSKSATPNRTSGQMFLENYMLSDADLKVDGLVFPPQLCPNQKLLNLAKPALQKFERHEPDDSGAYRVIFKRQQDGVVYRPAPFDFMNPWMRRKFDDHGRSNAALWLAPLKSPFNSVFGPQHGADAKTKADVNEKRKEAALHRKNMIAKLCKKLKSRDRPRDQQLLRALLLLQNWDETYGISDAFSDADFKKLDLESATEHVVPIAAGGAAAAAGAAAAVAAAAAEDADHSLLHDPIACRVRWSLRPAPKGPTLNQTLAYIQNDKLPLSVRRTAMWQCVYSIKSWRGPAKNQIAQLKFCIAALFDVTGKGGAPLLWQILADDVMFNQLVVSVGQLSRYPWVAIPKGFICGVVERLCALLAHPTRGNAAANTLKLLCERLELPGEDLLSNTTNTWTNLSALVRRGLESHLGSRVVSHSPPFVLAAAHVLWRKKILPQGQTGEAVWDPWKAWFASVIAYARGQVASRRIAEELLWTTPRLGHKPAVMIAVKLGVVPLWQELRAAVELAKADCQPRSFDWKALDSFLQMLPKPEVLQQKLMNEAVYALMNAKPANAGNYNPRGKPHC